MNTQEFKNGNQKFPLSTEALEFMQEQIKLVAGLTSLAGTNIIVKEPGAKNGLVIFNGELLPLTGSKNGNTRIAIRVTPETLTIEGFNGIVRTSRVAYYTNNGGTGETKKNISDFTVLKSIAALMSELDEAKQHHMPKGSIIDWHGTCRAANVPYGYVPCGWFGEDLSLSEIEAELTAWNNKYPGIITIERTYSDGSRLYISRCNNQVVPNLTDRFVVQAGHSYSLSDTGGEDFHALTVQEMPKHSHPFNLMADITDGGSNALRRGYSNSYNINGVYNTGYTGGNDAGHTEPHENRPPYYALYKLIKVI